MRRFLFLLCLLPPPAIAADAGQCIQQAYAGYSAAFSQFQHQLAEAVAGQRPELAEVAALRTRREALLAEQNRLRLRYLAGSDPARLKPQQGVGGLAGFAWTREDENRLRVANPDYTELAAQIEEVSRKANAHPRLRALAAFISDGFFDGTAYSGLLAQLQSATRDSDAALARCGALPQRPKPRSLTE